MKVYYLQGNQNAREVFTESVWKIKTLVHVLKIVISPIMRGLKIQNLPINKKAKQRENIQ